MKTINFCVIVWAIYLVLVCVFALPLQSLWIFYVPILLSPILGGIILLIPTLIHGFRKSWRRALPSLLSLAAGLTLFFTCGAKLGDKAYFLIRKSHYERLLAEAIRTGTLPLAEGKIDQGPPVRYAFMIASSPSDNWVAVVYDPSGEVMRVNQAKNWTELRDPALADVVGLFLGDLYQAEDMGGGWYLCTFT